MSKLEIKFRNWLLKKNTLKEETGRKFYLDRDQGITTGSAVVIMATIICTEERLQEVVVKPLANSVGVK